MCRISLVSWVGDVIIYIWVARNYLYAIWVRQASLEAVPTGRRARCSFPKRVSIAIPAKVCRSFVCGMHNKYSISINLMLLQYLP